MPFVISYYSGSKFLESPLGVSSTGKSSPEDLSTSIDIPTVIFQQSISGLNKSSLIVSGCFNLDLESERGGGKI